MDHEIPIVDQGPSPVAEPLHPRWANPAILLERFLDVLRQGDDLSVRAPGAEQEIIRVPGKLPDVQGADLAS